MMDQEEPPKQPFDIGRLIGALFLTLVAIPVLLIATCIPMMQSGMAQKDGVVTWLVVAGVLFVGLAIVMAARMQDPGARWGIAIGVTAALLVTFIFLL